MTEDTNDHAGGSAARYEVGYGKPPKNTRFKKGFSGNPRGRPRGSKNKRSGLYDERLKDIILDEAYRTISVRDGDKNVRIPMAQAVVRSMAVNAAKGQHRAQRLFSDLLSSTERSRKDLHTEWFEAALTYKLEWQAELDRRAERGITNLPEPLPHPEQIELDMRTGTVKMRGPMTREEKADWDELVELKTSLSENVDDLKVSILSETDPEECAEIQKHIELGEKLLAQIRRGIPD